MNKTPCFSTSIVCLALLSHCLPSFAQQCSPERLTAKYWQYRETFNNHFIAIDRRPEGCIGDGIHLIEGIHPTSIASQEHCGELFLSGYSLPATSFNMHPNGAAGLDDRHHFTGAFPDLECADLDGDVNTSSISWNYEVHNHLEMGEETPHQMQWYWTTLATEYALLNQNGQTEEAQRVLEELYLGLQAYRRMDMLANCMAEERYQEITDDFEVEDCYRDINGGPLGGQHDRGDCLCGPKYVDSPGGFNDNFKTYTQNNCPFQADLSGYTGFALREDGTQLLGTLLHDPSEDQWNIDLVFSDYGLSSMPPCTTAVSQACYNVQNKNFLSHDQMYALMQGLVMIKKFIPPYATVTTCEGAVENVLDIAQNIGKGLVDVAQNDTRRINWPGAEDCCDKTVHISATAGGYLSATYAGLEMMYNYLSDSDDRTISIGDYYLFNAMGTSTLLIDNSEGAFYLEAISYGMDIGNLPTFANPFDLVPEVTRGRVERNLNQYDLQIYSLVNNLLFPDGHNVPVDKEWFKALLCKAPCGGPCQKPDYYDETLENGLNPTPPDPFVFWPEFDCSNTPDWTGQRWEGLHGNLNWGNIHEARQFNGLDFMALYNLYLLSFPEEQTSYYNPDRPELVNDILLDEEMIEGPTTLCPGQSGTYSLASPPTPMPSILWESSNNITLSSTSTDPTIATAQTAQTPSYIGVSYQQTNQITQYYNGDDYYVVGDPPQLTHSDIDDVCDFSYHKHIVTEVPDYDIVPDIDPCVWRFRAEASGPVISGVSYFWTVTDSYTGQSLIGTQWGISFQSLITIDDPNASGIISIRLIIQSSCNTIVKTLDVPYSLCSGGGGIPRQVIISPNPANSQVSIRITQNESEDFVSTDPNGVRIRIYPANGGTMTLMDSYLYANGQYFNTATIPNGLYMVRATASDLLPPVQANLAIVR